MGLISNAAGGGVATNNVSDQLDAILASDSPSLKPYNVDTGTMGLGVASNNVNTNFNQGANIVTANNMAAPLTVANISSCNAVDASKTQLNFNTPANTVVNNNAVAASGVTSTDIAAPTDLDASKNAIILGAIQQATANNAVAAGPVTAGSANGNVITAANNVSSGNGLTSAVANAAGPVTIANNAAYTAAKAGNNVGAGVGSTIDAETGEIVADNRAKASTYDAAQTTLDAGQDTVQGQINSVIAKNSELMQRADARAQGQMNSRGILNSSMAVGAGQAAVMDAALPIATADAAAYARARENNTAARNAAMSLNAQSRTDVSKYNAGLTSGESIKTAELYTQVSLANQASYADISKFNTANALQAGIVNQSQANEMEKFNAANLNQVSQFNLDAAMKVGIVNQDQANKMAAINAANKNQTEQFNIDQAVKTGVINQDQANQMAKYNESNKIAVQ